LDIVAFVRGKTIVTLIQYSSLPKFNASRNLKGSFS